MTTRMFAKRLFDVVFGSTLMIVAVPLIAILGVVAAVSLRAWPFFTHKRIGHLGRPFHLVKLRTLPVNTARYALKANGDHPSPGAFARLLRRRHLDELPQLLLVPVGKMSLVGPRPKMPDAVEPVDPAYGQRRVQVPQGCSGLWQISEHSDQLPHDHPEYDFFYLAHSSLRLDLWILWRTALLMVGVAGPVSLAQVPAWSLSGLRSEPERSPHRSRHA